MYSLTAQEGMLLSLGVLAVATWLVLGVFAGFPRSRRTVSAVVVCPTIGQRAPARTRPRRVDAAIRRRQALLGARPARRRVLSGKGCLRSGRPDCLSRG